MEEGVALRAADIDVTYIAGYGFPAWLGGPMFYADTVGLPAVAASIERFRHLHGEELWPRALLLNHLAHAGRTFASFDQSNEV